MTFKAVIFDLDGVLVDTERIFLKVRLAFLDSKGIAHQHIDKRIFRGRRMQDIWQEILAERYDAFDAQRLQEEYIAYRDQQGLSYRELLFSDAIGLLNFLKAEGYQLALATSTGRRQIRKFFDETGLESYFPLICSGEDFQETKPNPEIYLTAMEKLGLKAEEVLIIEDSTVGIEAGKASGAEVWAIADLEKSIDQSKADRLFDDLTAIKKVLEDEG